MLGNQIKFFRKSLGLNQTELAQKLSLTQEAISKYEKNLREPDIETLKRLCIIFDCTADELLEIDTPLERKKVVINHSFNNSKDISLKI